MGAGMTKKPGRSIISSFSALAADAASAAPMGGTGEEAPERKGGFLPPSSGVIPPRVAAGVIGATQRTLTDIRKERDRLQAQVAASAGAQDVDPGLVDPSPFRDRLPDDDSATFETLKSTIAQDGQKVPVELRPHPSLPGRFQLVYGHRRWRAALELGIGLKAIVADMDDQGLAVAQGIENSARQDLSWIEKALFAWQMDKAGIRARDIRAALGVDDPEIARYRSVCRTLGLDLIQAIGRAPRIGRPRWIELAERVGADAQWPARLAATLAAAKDRSSDERFAACMAAVAAPRKTPRGALALHDPAGRSFGSVAFSDNSVRLQVEKREAEAFLAFFEQELPDLVKRYLAQARRS
jgi:ParB family transcriptional regulator, chromosome partitioning protein